MARTRQARLGRGLSTLMAQGGGEEAPERTAEAPNREPEGGRILELPLDRIEPNEHQPRAAFDDESLQSLADSIRQAGVLQPVVVRQAEGERYQLIAGERRWRAARMAGLDTVPAIVRAAGEGEAAETALIENLQRRDLDPMEQAEAFARLRDDFGLSHDAIAERVGLNRATVTNALRLRNLAAPVQRLVRAGELGAAQAKVLAGVDDPERQQALAARAVREAWSARKTEEAVKAGESGAEAGSGSSGGSGAAEPSARSAQIEDLERQIGEALQTRVRIKPGRKKGSGTLSIEFYSIDEFDRLLARLGVEPE